MAVNMGTKKEKTIQRSIRLPISLMRFIEKRAERYHGKDFTAAIIELLYHAREIIIEEEYWIRQKRRGKERIGEGLVRRGKMTKEQAQEVLRIQKEKYNNGKRFGEIAIELLFINQDTLDEYLASKVDA